MVRLTDKWYQTPSFLEDSAVVRDSNEPTGSILFRDSTGAILESLDFGILLATSPAGTRTSEVDLSFEYTGYYPIEVFGFYLTEVPREEYSGFQEPGYDLKTVLGWADSYHNPADKDDHTRCGLHLKQVVLVNNAPTTKWRTFRSLHVDGRGGSSGEPMKMLVDDTNVSLTQVINPGDLISFSLKLIAPVGDEGEILNALVLRLGFDVSFQEVNEIMRQRLDITYDNGLCGAE